MQETDGQAHPRFWLIGDYRWESRPEGFSDEYMVCLPSWGSYDTLSQDFINDVQEHAEYADVEITSEFLRDVKGIECDSTLLDFLKKHFDKEAYLVPVSEEHYIVPNTFFLTKQDAKSYLEKYGYNHSSKAHTYAMTAIRSPKYEKLINLIMEAE